MRRPVPPLAALGLALALLSALPACTATPPTTWPIPPVVPRERLLDITDYDIALDIDLAAGHIDGQVTVQALGLPDRRTDRMVLDAVELNIHAVTDDQGEDLAFELADDLLTIQLGRTPAAGELVELTIEYDAFPRRGMYFVPPAPEEGARPWQVWTQGQSEETRHWVPVRDMPDERATHTLALTVAADMVSMAAGELIDSRERRDGRRTDTWRMDTPHVAYLMTLVVGGFEIFELPRPDALPDVPLPVLVEAADVEHARANLDDTGAMLAEMGAYLDAPYPYVKYAQCCVKEYTGGGMENISATTLYYRVLHDPADEPQVESDGLVAHEAAHQWFGDLITCRDWSHIWLNEGFADYMENLWFRAADGADAAAWRRLESQRAYVSAELRDSRPVVWDGYEHPDDTFDDHVYPGGAARLHLLASVLGEQGLQDGLRAYVARRRETTVVTEDLRHDLQQTTGADLELFFEQWLYGPGFPELRARLSPDADTPELLLEQTQDRPGWPKVFHAPVWVSWSRGGVEHRALVQLDQRVVRRTLDGDGALDWFCVDDDARLPKLLDLQQTEIMWAAQLRRAERPLVRRIAAEWFGGNGWTRGNTPAGWRPTNTSFEALMDCVDQDDAVPVRLAALEALCLHDDPRLVALLERAIIDPEPEVRQSAAAAFGIHGSDEQMIPPVFDALHDPNASVVAAALGALVERRHPAAQRELRKAYEGASLARWRLSRSICDLMAGLDQPGVVPFLMGAATANPEERVRAQAVERLGGLGGELAAPYQEVIQRSLGRWLYDPSYRVRAAAARALGRRGRVEAIGWLAARRDLEIDPTVLGALNQALEKLQ